MGAGTSEAWCLEEGATTSNLMALVKKPRVPEKLVKFVSVDDLKQLLAACDGTKMVDRRDHALILMYADTGLRLSELATALAEDLDLRGGP